MSALHRIFRAHPEAADEGYFEHMAFALGFSARLLRAAMAALAHGFVPCCCETTASTAVLKMSDELRARRALVMRARHGGARTVRQEPARSASA